MLRRTSKESNFFVRHMEMWLIVLGCILLRAHYVANTVYNVRAYDWDGHIQYISYIVDHMQLPPVTLGWETTQAPLYYVIAALWTKAGIWVGRFPTVFPDLKLLSFLLSIATMGAAAWLSFVIFPRKTAERARLLFIGLVGTLPSLAFFSSRITNDTLVPLVMFVFIGCCRQGDRSPWPPRKWLGWSASCHAEDRRRAPKAAGAPREPSGHLSPAG